MVVLSACLASVSYNKGMSKRRSLNYFFPPPNFLLLPSVGIDISDRSIKYAELIPTASGLHLGRFGEVVLPPGIVENGRIVTSVRLEEELSKLRREKKLVCARAALPEEQMYFFQTRLPAGSYQELREAIELSIDEHVPMPPSETVFDFEIVDRIGNEVEVSVTAAASSVIESYADTFSHAGILLRSLELEAEAVARAVIHPDDTVARLLVDFGETRTGIAIVERGHVRFTSTVSIGGQLLTETLAKNFKVSIEEAEKMKREFGLRRNSPHQDLFSILLNDISVLRDEINKHFVYWHTHTSESGGEHSQIEEIVLVGGDSNLAGLPDYLSTSLRVRTVVADVWTNVTLPEKEVPDLSRNDSLGYATAIGLALHSTDQEAH